MSAENRKGISLPVNMIVILLLAVIVMAAVIAFFLSSGSGSIHGIQDTAALTKGCNILISNGCTAQAKTMLTRAIQGYNVDGRQGRIIDACKKVLGTSDTTECFNYCCGVQTGTAVKKASGESCTSNAQCQSNKCVSRKCK